MESTSHFPALFSPLDVGPIVLKNRIVNSAHGTGYTQAGGYTDRLRDYHRERAVGGAALIVSQATSVVGDYVGLYNSSDVIIDQYRDISAALAVHGAHYGAELYHPGALGSYSGDRSEVFVAPSGVMSSYMGSSWRVPHELTEAEIGAIVDAFRDAAVRCRVGGLSSIELHFAHGNLVEQFISRRTNHRLDDWGGPLDNRLKLARLICEAARAGAGSALAIGARLTADGFDAGEHDMMEAAETIGTIGSWGLLDYVSITMGHYADSLNTARNIPNMSFEPATWARYGKQVKAVVEVPVFLVGRINHPQVAEELIERGSCDAVVMARALIADPHLPNKASVGAVSAIRPCVAAMNCLHALEKGKGIRCIHNPQVGREAELPELVTPADVVRRVVVVGGGPAGLECARAAAQRGHEVVLVEAALRLGGQVVTAAQAPRRGELQAIVDWLVQQCEAMQVDVRLGVTATSSYVDSLAPDVVVVATGSNLSAEPLPEQSVPQIPWDAAILEPVEAKRVAVYDELSDWQGMSVAHALARKGAQVIYLTPTPFPGSSLELTNWRTEYAALGELGVEFLPVTTVRGFEDDVLLVERNYSTRIERIRGLQGMVSILAPRAQDDLFHELQAAGAEVRLIGDAYAPRGIEQAVTDGRLAGLAI